MARSLAGAEQAHSAIDGENGWSGLLKLYAAAAAS
jgi:hypothetical protein